MNMNNLKTFTLAMILIGGLTLSALAQKSGTIVYEQIINIHKSLSPEQQAFKAMIPETISKKLSLRFNENYARLQEVKKDQPKGISINISSSSDAWFDFSKKEYREYHNIMGESLCVVNSIPAKVDLEPTGNSKTILGYPCQEMKTEDGKFSIWYTSKLNIKGTPLLPLFATGTILLIENDKVNITAIQFTEKTFTDKELNQLPEAQQISSEQLEDIQEEARDEMNR